MEMNKYHKIETIFKRDPITKQLKIGEYTNPTVEFLKDITWQFTEKVDGTNIRVFWDGHKIRFAGRTDNAQIPSMLISHLCDLFGGEVNEQLFEQKFGEREVMLVGEGYGRKIQNNGYTNEVKFILFDVQIGGNWQSRECVEEIANYFQCDIVPIVCEGTLEDGINYVINNRDSVIAEKPTLMEGVVARPKIELQDRCGHRVIVKIKFCDFDRIKRGEQ